MKIKNQDLKVHFIGVGGVSMSSLANYLYEIGFTVCGSDIVKNEYTEALEKKGCKIFLGHKKDNVNGAQVVVYNSAIGEDNEELCEAKRQKLFLLTRAELLKIVSENFRVRVGVCGCNGKTTVTCMLAHIFKCAKKRFTAHIGGNDNKLANSYVKGSEYFISEVCEYKKNIDEFTAEIGVCLNTGEDHLECYSGKDELIGHYFEFLKRSKTAVIYGEDENLKRYAEVNAVTFGEGKNCDYKIKDVASERGRYSFKLLSNDGQIIGIRLKVYGRHNVLNAAAAATAAMRCGIDEESIKRGLENFSGTKRRFELIGRINGAKVIADYAHHPEEIAATLSCAEEIARGKIYVVFQPHTYSRTIILKDEFVKVLNEVDNLILYKTFPAREEYLQGGSAYDLYNAMDKKGSYFAGVDALLCYLKGRLKRSDTLLVLGAGDLYNLIKSRL